MLDQLSHVLTEQREGRVGHHDVCLLEQFDGFLATEVAVTLERLDPNLLGVGDIVAVSVARVLELDRLLGVVLAEEIDLLVPVASRDELLQAQLLEVVGEVVEEVATRGSSQLQ